MSTPQILTNSRLSCFRACPRRHFLRYELGLRREEEDLALRVGTAFHLAVEADDKGHDVEAAISVGLDDPYDQALVAAMFDGHRRRWAGQHLEPVAAELAFEIDLTNPETGAATPVFRLAGVIDRIVRLPDGRLAIQEYKTTSRDFAPGADYWVRLHLDQQLSIYVIAARALGYEVETVLYDVTRRPAQRPSGVPVLDDAGVKIVLGPDGQRVRTKDGKKWRETGDAEQGYVLQTRPETPEEFTQRVAKAIAADPDAHFARIEIARLEQDLDECRRDVWRQQKVIRDSQLEQMRAVARGQRPTVAWSKNPESCMQAAGMTCEFLSVCQTNQVVESQIPAGFVRVDDVHPELARHATSEG